MVVITGGCQDGDWWRLVMVVTVVAIGQGHNGLLMVAIVLASDGGYSGAYWWLWLWWKVVVTVLDTSGAASDGNLSGCWWWQVYMIMVITSGHCDCSR